MLCRLSRSRKHFATSGGHLASFQNAFLVCASTSEEANTQLVQLVAEHSLFYSWQHTAIQEGKFKISLIFPHKMF
jgi:hypothetical protein